MVQTKKIQNISKSIFTDIDLLGTDVLMENLKKYPFISWKDKGIPKEGSPAVLIEQAKILNAEQFKEKRGFDFVIEKLILHRNGSTTIKTNIGYYQFFACGGQNLTKD